MNGKMKTAWWSGWAAVLTIFFVSMLMAQLRNSTPDGQRRENPRQKFRRHSRYPIGCTSLLKKGLVLRAI